MKQAADKPMTCKNALSALLPVAPYPPYRAGKLSKLWAKVREPNPSRLAGFAMILGFLLSSTGCGEDQTLTIVDKPTTVLEGQNARQKEQAFALVRERKAEVGEVTRHRRAIQVTRSVSRYHAAERERAVAVHNRQVAEGTVQQSGSTGQTVVSQPQRSSTLVSSTAYCLTGTMANGEQVHDGAVAMNDVPFGTQYRILDGPLAGKVVTVKDRIGHSSEFDIWFASCGEARQYGRRSIKIERLN